MNSLIVPGLAHCTLVSLADLEGDTKSVAVVQSAANCYVTYMLAFYINLTSDVTGLSHQISARLCQNSIQHVCKHISSAAKYGQTAITIAEC